MCSRGGCKPPRWSFYLLTQRTRIDSSAVACQHVELTRNLLASTLGLVGTGLQVCCLCPYGVDHKRLFPMGLALSQDVLLA